MTIAVRGPDGVVHRFPDDTPESVIQSVMSRTYSSSQLAARANAVRAENQPKGLFGGFTDQVFNNLGVGDEMAGAAAAIVQGGRNLANTVTGRPNQIDPMDAYNAAAQVRKEQAAQYRQDNPLADAAATVGGIAVAGRPATVGMAPAAIAPMSAKRAALTAATLNAPFAVARQEGSLEERLPGAAKETAIAAAFGGSLQGIVNRLAGPAVAGPSGSTAADRIQMFERAGVRPTFAALTGNETGGLAKGISENAILGVRTRNNLQASLEDTRQALAGMRDQYGQVRGPQIAGEEIAAGVTRFARDADTPGTFAQRSASLYDDAFGKIDLKTTQGISTGATQRALAEIQARAQAPNIAELVTDPQIKRIAQAVTDDQGKIVFGDLRALRTWVREAKNNPQLRQGLDDAALGRLEGALTQDIRASANAIGGAAADRALRRADQYYRAGTQRLKQVDKRFGVSSESVSAEGVYAKIRTAAQSSASADASSLLALKRSVANDEWGDLVATMLDDMGKPAAGAANAAEPNAFSVTKFVTEYNKLSPRARDILFGTVGGKGAAGGLREALDNLARVAAMQKGVEVAANASRSGVTMQNMATIGGIGYAVANPGVAAGAGAMAAGTMVTGEMLTNPAFVRWLAAVPRAGQTTGGWRAHVAQLAQLASRDPALSGYYTQLVSAQPSSPARPQ